VGAVELVEQEIEQPRVFVANFAGHDYTKAKKYGEVVFVTKGFISFQGLDRLKFQIAERLLDSRPEDWLALSGTNIINVLAGILWYQRHGVVKILNFDKTSQTYRELIVTVDNNQKLFEVLDGSS